jgi:hypothetical protein
MLWNLTCFHMLCNPRLGASYGIKGLVIFSSSSAGPSSHFHHHHTHTAFLYLTLFTLFFFLPQVPKETAGLLEHLSLSFDNKSDLSRRLSSNLLHGSLLQVLDLVTNLHRFVNGESADMGSNQVHLSLSLSYCNITIIEGVFCFSC